MNKRLEADCFVDGAKWSASIIEGIRAEISNGKYKLIPKEIETVLTIANCFITVINEMAESEANSRYPNAVTNEEMERDRIAGLPLLHPNRNK